jgi:ABC-type oligopeptide transport system ATPase subunit
VVSCDGGIAVQIKDGVFAWDDEEVLRGINLEIQGGALAAVVGMVGSGKSSLLGCILGETSKVSGKVYLINIFVLIFYKTCGMQCIYSLVLKKNKSHMHHQPTTQILYNFNEREPLFFKCMKFVWFTTHLFTHSPLSQLFIDVHDTCLIFSLFLFCQNSLHVHMNIFSG